MIIWDLNTRKIQFKLSTEHRISSILVLPDNRILLYMLNDEIQLWDEGKLIFKGNNFQLLETLSENDIFLIGALESTFDKLIFLLDGKVLKLTNDNLFIREKHRPTRLLLKNVKYMDIFPNNDLVVNRNSLLEVWNLGNMKLQEYLQQDMTIN